ncbi:MAG: hypothetical protein ACT4N1_03900 [Nitrososphaerota archaeon]
MTSTFVKCVMIGLAGLVLIVVLYSVGLVDSCSIKHVGVVSDLKKYEETLDAEFCEDLINRIIELNDQCGIEIEIIDCG